MDIFNLPIDWAAVNAVLANIVTALVIAVLGVLAEYGRRKLAQVKAQMGADEYDFVAAVVRAAVMAAEQTALYEGWVNAAKQKKELAISYAQSTLDQYGIRVDVTALEAQIEASVLEELNLNRLN